MMDIYQRKILDHFHHPRNYGHLPLVTHSASATNSSCGDEIKLYLKIREGDGIIEEVSFEGRGCALCIASASLLTDFLKGRDQENVRDLDQKFMEALVCPVSIGRRRCLMLPLKALNQIWD